MKNDAFFETVRPEEVGIPSQAIIDMIDELEARHIEAHSMIISRYGRIAAEFYWKPYTAGPHRIYSANKCTNMLQTLFAVQEGYFGIDDRLADLMPESMPEEISENLSKMTVRHLLTMTTGHAKDTFGAILAPGVDRAKAFFSEPVVYEPGTHFLYNNGVPDMLALLCTKYTGETVLPYMEKRLFEPLGIHSFSAYMNGDQPELPTAAISLRDLFKIAMLLRQNGKWNGVQLIRENLISEAGKPQVSNTENSLGRNPEQIAGYGWQLWRNSIGGYRIDGGKGQYGIVLPEYDMVIAINSNETGRNAEERDVVFRNIVRRSFSTPLKDDPEGYARLQEKLASLSLQLKPTGISDRVCASWKMNEPVYGRSSFDIRETDGLITFTADDKEPVVFRADGGWYPCRMPFDIPETEKDVPSNRLPAGVAGADKEAACVSAVWEAKGHLTMMFRSEAWDGGYLIGFDWTDGVKSYCETSDSWQYRTSPDFDESSPLAARINLRVVV